MKTARRQRSFRPAPARLRGRSHARLAEACGVARVGLAKARELAELRARLAEAEETLRAIRTGEVDAVVVAGKQGPQVFTLEGAEHAYRMLIESMNEGALTLTGDMMILYANQCFARMVKCRLEQVIGSSFRGFLSAEDRARLRPLLERTGKSGSKIRALLKARDGSQVPVHISIRPLARNSSQGTVVGMVATDLTEVRRTETKLRELTHRLMQAQEAERGSVALELHDRITQLLCAVLVRSQGLADKLSKGDRPGKREATKLRKMLGQTAEEVERISRNLRPSALDDLGLAAVLRDTGAEFAERTGVSVKLACVQLTARLPADTELTLYRILQEALKNVEQQALARHVTVRLRQEGAFVELAIHDDGIGFAPDHLAAKRQGNSSFGLLAMRERAAHVGGAFSLKTTRRAGTQIKVRIPLSPSCHRG